MTPIMKDDSINHLEEEHHEDSIPFRLVLRDTPDV